MGYTKICGDYWNPFQVGTSDALFMQYTRLLEDCSLKHYLITGNRACRGCEYYYQCVRLHSGLAEKCCDLPLTVADYEHYVTEFNKVKNNGYHSREQPKVEIPKPQPVKHNGRSKSDRNEALLNLRSEGYSIPELAKRFDITGARVWQLIHGRNS